MKKINLNRPMNKWAFWCFLWFGMAWIFVAMVMSNNADMGYPLSLIFWLPVVSTYSMSFFKPDGKIGVRDAFAFVGNLIGVFCITIFGLVFAISIMVYSYNKFLVGEFSIWEVFFAGVIGMFIVSVSAAYSFSRQRQSMTGYW